MKVVKGKIIDNQLLAEQTSLYDMRIYIPEIASCAEAGQFVLIKCGDSLTLRRPISICDADESVLRICYDVRGEGTRLLSRMRAGMDVDVMGPLGHGFALYPEKRALLVGGGIGIYPLLLVGKHYGANAKALLGFRTAALVNMTEDFARIGVAAAVITDDGTGGRKGFVTELVREELASGGWEVVYVCGPKPMMKGVAALAAEYGVECQVSMEERMGCGVGACQACVCGVKTAEGVGYKRVCADGPVFDAKEIEWE